MRHKNASERLHSAMRLFTSVLNGQALRQAAFDHGIAKTTAEKRVRVIERALRQAVRIDGYAENVPIPLAVMRMHRYHYLDALQKSYVPGAIARSSETNAMTDTEIGRVVDAAKYSVRCAPRDVALITTLFDTGATPLEIGRLTISDFLQTDGDVRTITSIRKGVGLMGPLRSLIWTDNNIEAVEVYLQDRATKRQGLHGKPDYRGFDPESALFLTENGGAFPIKIVTSDKGIHYFCHSLLDVYRRIFLRSGVPGVSTRSARRTLACRLSLRGATEEEIGHVLGIKRKDCVRAILIATTPSLQTL